MGAKQDVDIKSITVHVQVGLRGNNEKSITLKDIKETTSLKQLIKIVENETQIRLSNYNCYIYLTKHNQENVNGRPQRQQISGRTLAYHNVEDNDKLSISYWPIRWCMIGGDIGVFTTDSVHSNCLTKQEFNDITEKEIDHIIKHKNGNPEANFEIIGKIEEIQKDQLSAVKTFVDNKYSEKQRQRSQDIDMEDFKYYLDNQELIALIGQVAYEKLISLFKLTPDEIIIRKCASVGKFIDFHTDVSLKTLQVALNDDTEYEGGRLVYASNGKLIAPKRTAGSITIHDNTIVHGVTRLDKGIRYGLFLLKKRVDSL